MKHCVLGLLLAASTVAAAPGEPTVAQMQWQRRVLLICTANASDARYQRQLQALSGWHGGNDRDVTIVRIEGDSVSGADEKAKDLRERYRLSPSAFSATLIGKDGLVASRSEIPLSTANLEGLIDAMPMRKAGQR